MRKQISNSSNHQNHNSRSYRKVYSNKNLAAAVQLALGYGYTPSQISQIEEAFKVIEGSSFEGNFVSALGLYGVGSHNTAFSSKGTAARDVRAQSLSKALAAITENFRQQSFDVDYSSPLSQVQRERSAGINSDLSGTVDSGSAEAAENDTVTDPVMPETSTGLSEAFGVFGQIIGAVSSGISMAQQFVQFKGMQEAVKQAEIATANEIEKSASLGVLDTLSLQKEFENGWKYFSKGQQNSDADAAIQALLDAQDAARSAAAAGQNPNSLTNYDPNLKGAASSATAPDPYNKLDQRFSGKNRQRFREAFDRQMKSIRTAGDYYALRNRFASERDQWALTKNSRYYSDSPAEVFEALSPLAEFSDKQRESFVKVQMLMADFNKAYYQDADGQWQARSDNAANVFNATYLGYDETTDSYLGSQAFGSAKQAAESAAYELSKAMSENQKNLMSAIFDVTNWLSDLYRNGNIFQKISAGSALTSIVAVQSQLFGQIFSAGMQSFGGPAHVTYSTSNNATTVQNAASVNGKGVVVTPTNQVP